MNFNRYWWSLSWMLLLCLRMSSALSAATVYTNEADFVSAIGASPSSLNEFSRLSAPMQYAHPLSFSQNGLTYAITTIPEFDLFWIAGAISTAETNDIIRIGFGSDNVHAVGGWCYLTDTNGVQAEGTLTIILSDGTTNVVSVSSNAPPPFYGFVTSDVLINWMTLQSGTGALYPTLDHFYVAEGVPALAAQLTITNTIALTWPATAPGYTLQTQSGLSSDPWTNAGAAVQLIGTRFRAIVPAAGANARFRLIKP